MKKKISLFMIGIAMSMVTVFTFSPQGAHAQNGGVQGKDMWEDLDGSLICKGKGGCLPEVVVTPTN